MLNKLQEIILVAGRSNELADTWRDLFRDQWMVTVRMGDICSIECDAIVSPANSFGFMDGGLDIALSRRFGWGVQKRLQALIADSPLGELLVGDALVVPTDDARVKWIVSAPTMRVPMPLKNTVAPYLAMRAALIAIDRHAGNPAITSVAIPGLGTGTGGVDPKIAAAQMWAAFREHWVEKSNFPKSWEEALRNQNALTSEPHNRI